MYVACWGLTWLLGPQSVEAWVRDQWQEDSRFFDNPKLASLDREVLISGENLPAAPWHFFGNAFSPCPFVVRVDFAFRYQPAGARSSHGSGTTGWCLWFFGRVVPFSGETYWCICSQDRTTAAR